MKRAKNVLAVCLAAGIVSGAAIGVASAQQDKKASPPATTKPATPTAKPDAKAPAGMSQDMKSMEEAMAAAATPGEMHKHLAKAVGSWKAQCTMWMAPDAEPIKSESTMTCKSIMNGLFMQCEMNGEVPGMGPMSGMGLYGYDTVAKKFQATWVTSCGSGMMVGTGEMQSDGSTVNWTYTHTCPIRQKACTMREVEKITGADTRTITTFMQDPVSGKEFKAMEMVLTRTSK